MPSSAEKVREILTSSALRPDYLLVEDSSDGCGSKFDLIVVSAQFVGKALLERHRAVHEALGSEMDEIHAVTMKTWTPEQYEAKKDSL
mmetsp:Transcript_1140/g.2598  ORF Transcript_1140/g.2598 Transcript_1140/m.2598 type:complete len:88 (-) Transcript_1140:437-700(-)